jgi:anti-sigma factor RsiW
LSCQRARKLIHPYIDGELDTLQTKQFRLHLGECEDCNLTYRNELSLSSTLKDKSLYYRAPQDLHKSIRLSLREEVETVTPQRSLVT